MRWWPKKMSIERGTLTPMYFEPLQYTNLSYLSQFSLLLYCPNLEPLSKSMTVETWVPRTMYYVNIVWVDICNVLIIQFIPYLLLFTF